MIAPFISERGDHMPGCLVLERLLHSYIIPYLSIVFEMNISW